MRKNIRPYSGEWGRQILAQDAITKSSEAQRCLGVGYLCHFFFPRSSNKERKEADRINLYNRFYPTQSTRNIALALNQYRNY